MQRSVYAVVAVALLTTTILSGTLGHTDEGEQISGAHEATQSQSANAEAKAGTTIENAGETLEGQSVRLLEWSDDQGKTWHPANGQEARAIPPVLKNYTIGFRAHKSAPELEWPRTDDGFMPKWTISEHGKKPRTLEMAETIWVAFENIAPKGTVNATVAVECGNKITVKIQEVYSRDEDW